MGAFAQDFHKTDAYVGILNFCTMYCSNFALKFVSYPFVVLAKSAKILPVCMTGVLFGVYKLTWTQTGLFITISSGLVIFNLNKVKNTHVDDESPIGLFLVLASLFFDGFTNVATDMNHRAQKRPFAYHSMLYTNFIGLVANMMFYAYAVQVNDD